MLLSLKIWTERSWPSQILWQEFWGTPFKTMKIFHGLEFLKTFSCGMFKSADSEQGSFNSVVTSFLTWKYFKLQLEKVLENVRNTFLEGKWQLPAKCALFVCNKWDLVPKKEDKDVKSHIVKKLKQSWPDFDPATQITYMSTLNATIGQNLGIVTEEFSTLMEGIKSMVLQGIDCRMEIHWRYLRCRYITCLF